MPRLLMITLALLCFGCSTTWKPVCRHKALYTASVVGEEHPVRIVWGRIQGADHVQTQGLIDDIWEWLIVNQYGYIDTIEEIPGFTPLYYMSFQKYLEWFGKRIKEEQK